MIYLKMSLIIIYNNLMGDYFQVVIHINMLTYITYIAKMLHV